MTARKQRRCGPSAHAHVKTLAGMPLAQPTCTRQREMLLTLDWSAARAKATIQCMYRGLCGCVSGCQVQGRECNFVLTPLSRTRLPFTGASGMGSSSVLLSSLKLSNHMPAGVWVGRCRRVGWGGGEGTHLTIAGVRGSLQPPFV